MTSIGSSISAMPHFETSAAIAGSRIRLRLFSGASGLTARTFSLFTPSPDGAPHIGTEWELLGSRTSVVAERRRVKKFRVGDFCPVKYFNLVSVRPGFDASVPLPAPSRHTYLTPGAAGLWFPVELVNTSCTTRILVCFSKLLSDSGFM